MMTKFMRIPDSDFTFHYEIKGPDESLRLRRNTHRSVGLKARSCLLYTSDAADE